MGASNSKSDVEYEELDLSHFKLLKVIGRGGFGMVRIVEEKVSKKQYALKYINKKVCVKKRSIENIFRERLLLQELDHPFITNLRFAFQDDDYMFMGLDLATGGDLKFHIYHSMGLSENTIRVYAAEVALALSYIHSHYIIHRDLKPDNILIDCEGHIRITDFNIAASTKEKFPSSRSGTLTYMGSRLYVYGTHINASDIQMASAPEMLSGKPYDYAVDWWALGTVMFECYYGHRPFNYQEDEDVKRSIRHEQLKFPKLRKSRNDSSDTFKKIVNEFLDKNKDTRLGAGGIDAFNKSVSKHVFFRGIDWKLVFERKVIPDFIPDMTKENFESGPALEEILYESSPLTPRRRKKKPQRSDSASLRAELSRDSLRASLSALRNADNTSHARKAEDGKGGANVGAASCDEISPKREKSKLSDKERAKRRERRELQFIEDHFTVYVQGTGVGILEKTTVNAKGAIQALESPSNSPAISDASLPNTDDGSVDEESLKGSPRLHGSNHMMHVSTGSIHMSSHILPNAPSRLKEVIRAESVGDLAQSLGNGINVSSTRSLLQVDDKHQSEHSLAVV